MNKNPKKANLQIYSLNESIGTEISNDFILPDRFPDVKKLLRVKAVPAVTSRYIQGKRLEITGEVKYSVLFSADGESGEEIHCAHFSAEWSCDIPDIGDGDNPEISITSHIASQTSRLPNPRKVSLRTTVNTNVKISHPISCVPKCEGDFKKGGEPTTEKLWENFTAKCERTFMSEPLTVSEVIESDAHQPQMDAIVDFNGCIRFYEVKPTKSGEHLVISMKGELIVSCLYKAMGEEHCYRSFARKIPISSTVDADEYAYYFAGCDEKSIEAYAVADITEMTCNIGENGYGERRCADISATADITFHLMGNESIAICTDSYSVDYETECAFREFDCESVGKVLSQNFSVGETLPREEAKLPENITIIDQFIELSPGTVTVDRGRALFNSDGMISCIYTDSDGSFASADFKVPVRFDANAGNIDLPVAYGCSMIPSDLRIGLSNDRISFDFEVSLSAEIFKKEHKKILGTLRILEKKSHTCDGTSLTLCYPASTDTLWNIAKRYNTTVEAIDSANKTGSRVLLIPTSK